MSNSKGFSDQELHQIKQALFAHYQTDIQIRLAQSEVSIDSENKRSIQCPTVFWHAHDTNFMVIKIEENIFRSQFFYTPLDQHDGGINNYQNVAQSVEGIIHAQGEHKRRSHSQ